MKFPNNSYCRINSYEAWVNFCDKYHKTTWNDYNNNFELITPTCLKDMKFPTFVGREDKNGFTHNWKKQDMRGKKRIKLKKAEK